MRRPPSHPQPVESGDHDLAAVRVRVLDPAPAIEPTPIETGPAWWTHPATEAQISYLVNLLDQRMVPDELRNEIDDRIENATKGEVARWLDSLKVAAWVQQTTDDPSPSSTPTVH